MGCKFKSLENEKIKNKRGLWSPDEDQKLRDYIVNHGIECWSFVPIRAGLQRNGKSCRLRWINYLKPGLKRGTFTLQEDEIIMTLHGVLGNKRSQMSQHLPGRTDNEIKNHWHSYMKKKKKVQNLENKKSRDKCIEAQNKLTPCSSSHTRTNSSLESSEAYGCMNLPKILFADWLSVDQFNISCGQTTVSNGELLNEVSFSGDIQERSSYGYNDSLDHQQTEYDIETDFYDLIADDI